MGVRSTFAVGDGVANPSGSARSCAGNSVLPHRRRTRPRPAGSSWGDAVSSENLGYVWRYSPYTGTTFTIHLALGDVANDIYGNEVWLRAAALADKARTTKETVARTLPRMTRDGFLQRLSGDGNMGVPIRYRFLTPDRPMTWDQRSTPVMTGQRSLPTTVDDTSHLPMTTRHTEPKQRLKNLRTKNFSSDVVRLCVLLADLVEANGSKRPNITERWYAEADRLIRLDRRTPSDIETLIRWSQSDPFWRSNILSMPTFRSRFDTLRLRSANGGGKETRAQRLARMAAEGVR